MFNRETVVVIGAGGGHDIKMPLGSDLASRISKALDVGHDQSGSLTGTPDNIAFARQIISLPGGSMKDDLAACRMISDGIVLANSIDDFLDLHKGSPRVVTMGKLGIVRCIAAAEAGSMLAPQKHKDETVPDFRAMDQSWLVLFMRTLAANTGGPDSIFNRVTFINFNYDRCLEYFLQHALQRLFGIDESRAISICRSAAILHPYGFLGPLPGWSSDGSHVDFGSELTLSQLVTAAERIKTYTEQVSDQKVASAMRVAIRDAKQILFLGFAFHKPNMALLRPTEPSEIAEIFATAMGIGEEDQVIVRREIGNLFKSPYLMDARYGHSRIRDDIDCAKLFLQYHKTLQKAG